MQQVLGSCPPRGSARGQRPHQQLRCCASTPHTLHSVFQAIFCPTSMTGVCARAPCTC